MNVTEVFSQPCPCDDCPMADVCASGKACEAFINFLNGEQGGVRNPVKKLYAKNLKRLTVNREVANERMTQTMLTVRTKKAKATRRKNIRAKAAAVVANIFAKRKGRVA